MHCRQEVAVPAQEAGCILRWSPRKQKNKMFLFFGSGPEVIADEADFGPFSHFGALHALSFGDIIRI